VDSQRIDIEPHQQQQPQEQSSPSFTQQRIYLVTDGLKSKHTKRVYSVLFNQFLRDGAHITDYQVLLDHTSRVLESMVIGYIERLRDKGRAHQTIKLNCAAIFHFFEMNDIILNKRKIMRFIPLDESSSPSQGDYYADGDKPYTVEQINRIINEGCGGDTRCKVIVLLMVSTAVRIGALPELCYRDLTYIPEHNLYKIRVYANSRHDRYISYCTPECASAINSYLDYRRRLGETIKNSSPLIREMFNIDNPFVIDSPKICTLRMMELALEQALKKSGVNQRTVTQAKGSRRSIMRSHGFRKFAITMMDKANVKDTHRRYLTGHAQVGQDASYVLPTEEALLAEYIKAIDLLTIDPTQRLRRENADLRMGQSEEAKVFWAKQREQDERIKAIEYEVKKRDQYIDQEVQRRIEQERRRRMGLTDSCD
jgi:hypothetical protein